MVIAALFVIAQTRNHPNAHQQVNRFFLKVVNPYNGTRLRLTKSELLINTTAWKSVKIIILNERSQTKIIHTIRLHLYKKI